MICLIVGDAPCRENDLSAFYDFEVEHDTCCINRAGLKHPFAFEHWFSWHADMLGGDWAWQRPGAELHSTYDGHPDVRLWDVPNQRGGSCLGAILVMIDKLGYDKVVLAGCPMEGEYKRFFDEFDVLDERKAKVRSMSGNTAKLLGYPVEEWLLS